MKCKLCAYRTAKWEDLVRHWEILHSDAYAQVTRWLSEADEEVAVAEKPALEGMKGRKG